MQREPADAQAVVASLQAACAGLAGVDALAKIADESDARSAIERLVLLAGTAALAATAPAAITEAFAHTRLAAARRRLFGTAKLDPETTALLHARVLPDGK